LYLFETSLHDETTWRDGTSYLEPQTPHIKLFIQIFAVVFLLLTLPVFSQTSISTDPDYVREKRGEHIVAAPYQRAYPDTTVDWLSEFFPRNILGNYGLASPLYELNFSSDNLGFRVCPNPYRDNRISETDARYYRSKGPFASLTGIAGSRQLQILKAFYTQTFRRRLNLAIRFNRYTSQGFYLRQQTYTNNFMLTANHTDRSERLGFYFFILNNVNRHQENGGISDGRLDDSTVFVRKELMRVKLPDESKSSRDNRATSVMINPWLRIGGPSDRAGNTASYLQWRGRVSFESLKYTDISNKTGKYYLFVFLDTLKTLDSTHLMQVRNDLLYTFRSGEKFTVSGGYRHELNQLWQRNDSVFMNHMAVGEMRFGGPDSTARFGSDSEVQYVISGPAEGNTRIVSRNTLGARNGGFRLLLNASYEKRIPDYIFTNWVSNHFKWWYTGYKPTERIQAEGGIEGKWWGASVIAEQHRNFLYFDNFALPRQDTLTLLNVGVKAHLGGIFFRHLGLYASYAYQQSDRPELMRLPPNIFTGRLFFNGLGFRKSLQIQFGGQLQVYDSFVPYGYMPATQAFYVQSTFSSAPYPFVDVFLQGRIRPVSFFFKVENVLQGFAGYNYALVRDNYQPDRAFRLGITWMFFD
jgi:hypothetical protein